GPELPQVPAAAGAHREALLFAQPLREPVRGFHFEEDNDPQAYIPGIANPHPDIVMWWSLLIGGAMLLWVQNCYADPGWLTPRTIFPQDHLIGDDPNDAFDAWQPVESQMAHCESLSQDVPGLGPGERSDGSLDLARLELEQNN
ncbi:unnamed protein product, partial [Prorocentrum cordatum]